VKRFGKDSTRHTEGPHAAVALVLILLASCSGPTPSPGTSAAIRYEVRLRDGGRVPIRVTYRLPSGEVRQESGTTPWSSHAAATFAEGSVMLVEARTRAKVESPLLCVLASEDPEQGSYVYTQVGRPLTVCSTQFELGRWPPNDDDPIGNPLIRVT
jgi:hypothetical protein